MSQLITGNFPTDHASLGDSQSPPKFQRLIICSNHFRAIKLKRLKCQRQNWNSGLMKTRSPSESNSRFRSHVSAILPEPASRRYPFPITKSPAVSHSTKVRSVRVVVQLSRSARQHLIDWRARIARSRTGSGTLAELMWDEIRQQLARTGGRPDGAQKVREEPLTYHWRCSADTLLEYLEFDDPGSYFHQSTRKLLITAIRQLPLPEE